MGRGGHRELIRVKPGTAAAVHSRAAQMQNAAGGAGVRVNRVLTATARPLARTPVHKTGKRAAKRASAAVASCANSARRAVHSAAGNSAAGEVGKGLFEMAASAPVFVAQALHSPRYMASNTPNTPPQIMPPPCSNTNKQCSKKRL